ncbi:DUF4397 domain-containing protein [Flavobacterium sp. MAH-1]|uniref:DUF4397 domain-containing protein n=1 Tax=Flavobacterium agri TaxID=2743471 RepID=A0A7Y9C6Y3_9FLAO|nr:DUF4397 domain-containing protein [Flavobacterium agri]NUY80733.1 DUF4397 domain-containing protein [Flavobacterium agri]NYA70757.1 DUF4397 domain-containing protein [Flavobacterium agri]
MKFRIFRNLFLAVAAIFTISSCSIDDDGTYYYDNAAHGIIGNASPNSGDLYFFADSNQVNMNGLNYGSAVGYYNFYPGDRVLTLKNGNGVVLDTYEISLAIGNFFSAFAVNTFDNVELVVYQDVLAKPAGGNARVRFINLSPDAEGIDVFDNSVELTSGLTFKQATPFMELPAGNYDFDFRLSADDSHLYTKTVSLHSGRIYTIYTKGFVTPETGSNDTFSAEGIYNY